MSKAKLGQHFLTRPEIAGWVAQSIAISDTDTVLEIGPGRGILTRELLKKAQRVVAIEKDSLLIPELKTLFQQDIASGKLILIEDDVRNFSPISCHHLKGGYVLVANIPYYITGYIIRKFLTTTHQPQSMAMLVQKEVAERVVAKNRKHSILSLSVHVFGTPSLGRIVKAGAFSPPPNVDSAILCIDQISRKNLTETATEKCFFELIKMAFSQKRKTLGATLKKTVTDETFAHCAIEKKTRPEDVSLTQWLCIAHQQLRVS